MRGTVGSVCLGQRSKHLPIDPATEATLKPTSKTRHGGMIIAIATTKSPWVAAKTERC
jgi:hypothetical protein